MNKKDSLYNKSNKYQQNRYRYKNKGVNYNWMKIIMIIIYNDYDYINKLKYIVAFKLRPVSRNNIIN